MPYYIDPAESAIQLSAIDAFSKTPSQAHEAYVRCREQYAPMTELADSEEQIYEAVRDVLGAICHVSLNMFLDGEAIWFTHFDGNTTVRPSKSSASEAEGAVTAWQRDLEELMAWLG